MYAATKNRRCIEYDHCDDEEERMRFSVDNDFVRVYYDPPGASDLHLLCVKNVEFTVLRSHHEKDVIQGKTSVVIADLDVSVTNSAALESLMRLEDALREGVQKLCHVENRVLLHRVRFARNANKNNNKISDVVTRLRFLNGRNGTHILEGLRENDTATANIALMGLKLSCGDVLPVWRATYVDAPSSETDAPPSSETVAPPPSTVAPPPSTVAPPPSTVAPPPSTVAPPAYATVAHSSPTDVSIVPDVHEDEIPEEEDMRASDADHNFDKYDAHRVQIMDEDKETLFRNLRDDLVRGIDSRLDQLRIRL